MVAKRQRNQEYLRGLGFEKKKANSKTRKSRSSNNKPEEEGCGFTVNEAAGPKRLVSPSASSYYDRYEGSSSSSSLFGVSLDGTSSATIDPFEQISSLILKLTDEMEKLEESALGNKTDAIEEESKSNSNSNSNPKLKTEMVSSLLEELLVFLSPGSSDSSIREKHIEDFLQLGGVSLVLTLLCYISKLESDDPNVIEILLLQVLRDACYLELPPPIGNNKTSASEKVALELINHDCGWEIIHDILSNTIFELESYTTEMKQKPPNGNSKKISGSGKERRRDSFPGGQSSKNNSNVQSPLKMDESTDAVSKIEKEIVHCTDIDDEVRQKVKKAKIHHAKQRKNLPSGSQQTISIRTSSITEEVDSACIIARQNKSLEMVSNIFGVYANLAYFESVTFRMGRDELLLLADLAYFTLTALDYHATQELARILPLCPSEHEPTKRNGRGGGSKKKPTSSKSGVVVTQEEILESRAIAMNMSRILEPVLGTIKNLVADPMTKPTDWETRNLVSMVLDIACKGEEGETNPKPNSNSNTNANDWLHFVEHTKEAEPPKVLAAASPPPTLFRWMEESEACVWELLGFFKVCLGKEILSTFTHDVELLVALWIRCLKKFGVSSSRITLRILGLVEGMVFSSSYYSAGIRKQIVLREGFLNELIDLSEKYSLLADRGGVLPSNGKTARTEIESMISRLRSKE